MTGRCRGADAVVQSLIYLQSMEMRVRLTRCRSYVVLVRRAKQPSLLAFSDAALAGVCSPRTASPLAASCWRQRRSQHGIPPPHFPGQRVPLPCTQQSADTTIFSIHSLRPESPGVHSSLLDPRRCARTTSNSSRLLATVALTPPSTSPHLPVAIHSRRLRLQPYSTDLHIDLSPRCRYSARLSPAGLWSDVHSLQLHLSIPSALLRASAKPPPLAQPISPQATYETDHMSYCQL
jgi:hypothetical protein